MALAKPKDKLKQLSDVNQSPPREKQTPGGLLRFLPRPLSHDSELIDNYIREGRFQRSLSLITAFSSLLAGLEVMYEHYRGSYSLRVMYTPVILSFMLLVTSVWAVFNRWVARVLMPITALLLFLDGMAGFFYHARGIHRKPGGWRIPIFNIVMGPPLFAPPLLGVSGFLGLIASMLRREDDLQQGTTTTLPHSHTILLSWLPQNWRHEGEIIEQDMREGRFQRALAVAAAISAFFSGVESLYSHYKNNFRYPVQWTPILLTPVVMIAGIGSVWSRGIACIFLPIASLLALVNGGIGFLYHIRGVLRRPGGLRKNPLYNIVYGPPIFAPLLFAASGFLGLLASLLRRSDK